MKTLYSGASDPTAAAPVPAVLAPAGGREQLVAAVRCGADAVYLGGKGFNARRSAENFGGEALASAVRYCHERGVKVYVTVNTMVLDRELAALEAEADAVAAAGADGVILQDMAALTLFSRRYPHIRRVASTQTAVHNADGARFLADAGFDGFVLARELSLDEMASICAAVDIPAEAFVHGAHCVCVSGMCTLSSMLGGRSGNRGLCAQPCRLDWRCGAHGHALSMKDMSLLDHIADMAAAGVRTLKIEGRMKRPEYVAAAVTACRAARDGEPYDAESLRAVFSRSGFTDGYLTGRRDAAMFGYRTREDVTDAEAVLKPLRQLYRAERRSVPVTMAFTLTADTSALTVSDGGGRTAAVTGPAPEPARTRPLDADSAARSLTKTGGTQYICAAFRADIAPGLTLPAAALNALRRDALAALDERRGDVPPYTRGPGWEQIPDDTRLKDSGENEAPSPLWARFYTADQLAAGDHAAIFDRLAVVVLPVGAITPAIIDRFGDRLAAELPAVCFPEDEPALETRLVTLKKQGLRAVWTENIYGAALGKRLGFPVVRGGFGLNAANAQAAAFYRAHGLASLTASFEAPMSAVKRLPAGAVVYGRLPLMRLRCCPVRASVGCAVCGGRGELTDRRGAAFPVECGGKRYATLLNSVPLDIAGRDDPGGYRLLWFTRESADECAAVIARFARNEPPRTPRTGGLYYRKLL